MNRFKGLVVFITGASAGIGQALALEMAKEGANLVILARRLERLKAIATEIDPSGQQVLPIACDVTKDDDLDNAAKLALNKFGQIDIVIANAGWAVRGNVEDLHVNDYQRLWETNVFGVLP
ncbi:MAG: SDR family oxidoreductase, partial [Xenococcus sp. (in: cyanobacteria)]